MSTEAWTQLVQQVDRLITELKAARAEAERWRKRATELDGQRLKDERGERLEEQAKDRELGRLRRERKKTLAVVEKMLQELDVIQTQVENGQDPLNLPAPEKEAEA